MKRNLSIFLQTVIVLVGIAAALFMVWEPTVEGRNVNSTLAQIYFADPFLWYAYIASISFFTVLYQTFRVLGLSRQNNDSSREILQALKAIRFSALAMIGFVWGGFIFLMLGESDDRPPLLMMATIATIGSIAIAKIASRYERRAA